MRARDPPHLRQFVLAIASDNRIDCRGRADIVAGLQVGRRRREPIQRVDFAPRVTIGESPTHARCSSLLCPRSADRRGASGGLRWTPGGPYRPSLWFARYLEVNLHTPLSALGTF